MEAQNLQSNPRQQKRPTRPRRVLPVPWVHPLKLFLPPNLQDKLSQASRQSGLPVDQVTALILGKLDLANPRFRDFSKPFCPIAANSPNRDQGKRRALTVLITEALALWLTDASNKTGIAPPKIALKLLEEHASYLATLPVRTSLAALSSDLRLHEQAAPAAEKKR